MALIMIATVLLVLLALPGLLLYLGELAERDLRRTSSTGPRGQAGATPTEPTR
jgi:hypothetical protein